jgi:plastocyanin
MRARLLAASFGVLAIVPFGAHASLTDVAVSDFAYAPKSVTIFVGDEVMWTYQANAGTAPHTVTGSNFDSGNMVPGGRFRWTFHQAGTFEYVCTYHPDLMTGTVTVKVAGQPTAAPTKATAEFTPAPSRRASSSETLAPGSTDTTSGPNGSAEPLETEQPLVVPPTVPASEEPSDERDPVAARSAAPPDNGSNGALAAGALLAITAVATGTWAAMRNRRARRAG